jgi:transposase
MLHAGIDLHKRDLVVTTVDPAGQLVKTARLRTTRPAVAAYFACLRTETADKRAVVESTATWYWLADLLRLQGIALTLGHSKYIKAISYAKVKTDAVDAATLAQLLRSDSIPEAHMISPELREPRDLLRQRLVLVAKRTRCKNAIAGLLAQYNVTTPAELPPLVRFQGELHAEQRLLLTRQIKRLEQLLQPTLIPDADVQRLLWIPGIGKIAAFTLYLEIDGIARFGSMRSFFSYCRLVPDAKNSGGKTRHKRTRDGNRYLKLAFSHAAVRAIQYYPEIRRWYEAKRRVKGPMIARALVAKELARIVYYVLHKPESFNGTFKGVPLSRTKQSQWPRLASPSS